VKSDKEKRATPTAASSRPWISPSTSRTKLTPSTRRSKWSPCPSPPFAWH